MTVVGVKPDMHNSVPYDYDTIVQFFKEEQAQKKSNEEFNSVTNKVKVENQNQTHNVRREGIGPQNQRK